MTRQTRRPADPTVKSVRKALKAAGYTSKDVKLKGNGTLEVNMVGWDVNVPEVQKLVKSVTGEAVVLFFVRNRILKGGW